MNKQIASEVAKRTYVEVKEQILDTPAVPAIFAIFSVLFLVLNLHLFTFLGLVVFSVAQVAWIEYKTLQIEAADLAASWKAPVPTEEVTPAQPEVVDKDPEAK